MSLLLAGWLAGRPRPSSGGGQHSPPSTHLKLLQLSGLLVDAILVGHGNALQLQGQGQGHHLASLTGLLMLALALASGRRARGFCHMH